jgi:hypothetical protein
MNCFYQPHSLSTKDFMNCSSKAVCASVYASRLHIRIYRVYPHLNENPSPVIFKYWKAL